MSDNDEKLVAVSRLQGVAAATTKTLNRILPSARKVAEQRTEVVASLFLAFFGVALGSLATFLLAAPLSVTLGLLLPALMGVGLTGGVLTWRLIPQSKRLEKRDALERMLEAAEEFERKGLEEARKANRTKNPETSQMLLEQSKVHLALARDYHKGYLNMLESIANPIYLPPTRDNMLGIGQPGNAFPRLPDSSESTQSAAGEAGQTSDKGSRQVRHRPPRSNRNPWKNDWR